MYAYIAVYVDNGRNNFKLCFGIVVNHDVF